VQVIKKLTRNEFVEIATNGLPVNLFDNDVADYINNLIKFIEDISFNIYVSNFTNKACSIAMAGDELIDVIYDNGKTIFYLQEADLDKSDHKAKVASIINTVYMHAVAWTAIHNGGVISENKIPKPCEPWPV
jgi:hypothetical protein